MLSFIFWAQEAAYMNRGVCVCATFIVCVSAGCAALQLCVGPALAMQSLSRLAASCGSTLGNICEFTMCGARKPHVSYESH